MLTTDLAPGDQRLTTKLKGGFTQTLEFFYTVRGLDKKGVAKWVNLHCWRMVIQQPCLEGGVRHGSKEASLLH